MKFLVVVAIVLAVYSLNLTEARPQTWSPDLHLIKTSESDEGRWLDQDAINALIRDDINFMDITGLVQPSSAGLVERNAVISDLPTALRYQNLVRSVLPRLNVSRIQSFIQSFSSYYNRYYLSATGQTSAEWLLSQVNASIAAAYASGYAGNASVRFYNHSAWPQPSVIARIEGADPSLGSEVVVLGAHEDSILSGNPTGNSPGADDDASGSVVLLETLRVLFEAGFVPKRSLEFQWYAAEEVGLRGSAAIASGYYSSGVNVFSMAQFDVVGYHTSGLDQIGVITDYTNANLTALLRLAVDEYCNYTWINRACGYACSDHASYYNYGFRASFAIEARSNPNMHTVRDTIDIVNFVQLLEFTKLGTAYAIELAEPFQRATA